ncbi:hypothetical protein [Mycobacterium sp.]|uniref:hypothetical protein n=1 Tax=Mycobacterium sp. TaxID=1785 RepID=UPI003C77AA6A
MVLVTLDSSSAPGPKTACPESTPSTAGDPRSRCIPPTPSCVDGDGPAVIVIRSYRRDGGEDFELFTAAVIIGSLMGAALAAVLVCLQRGYTPRITRKAVKSDVDPRFTATRLL